MAALILVFGASCMSSIVSGGGLFYTCTDGTLDTEEYDSNLCLSFLSTKCHKIETQEKCDKKEKCQWDIFASTANCISIDDTLTVDPATIKPSGRYVKIKQTSSNVYINLAEVEVYDSSNTLVSNNKTITGSSVQDTNAWANLVDGNKTNFTSTSNTTSEYLQIDLGAVKEIQRISITNRTDCCKDRINGVKVQILNESNVSVKETPTITLPNSSNAADTYTLTFPENIWKGTYNVGSPLKCLSDVGTTGAANVYRLDSLTQIRLYPDATIATSWDTNYATNRLINCSDFTVGTPMALKPTATS